MAYLSPYSTSKHACDTYAACLRMELQHFGIGVTTVLASFHKTPLIVAADGTFRGADYVRKTWDRMAASKQAEYGEAVLECLEYSSDALLIDFAWDPLRVNEACTRAQAPSPTPEPHPRTRAQRPRRPRPSPLRASEAPVRAATTRHWLKWAE